jgi:hypothetical protein
MTFLLKNPDGPLFKSRNSGIRRGIESRDFECRHHFLLGSQALIDHQSTLFPPRRADHQPENPYQPRPTERKPNRKMKLGSENGHQKRGNCPETHHPIYPLEKPIPSFSSDELFDPVCQIESIFLHPSLILNQNVFSLDEDQYNAVSKETP